MLIDILTIFPKMFEDVLNTSILKIALQKGVVRIGLHNIRDYSTDKHRKTDDAPYGGGPGMIMTCDPVFRAVEAVRTAERKDSHLVLLTPQGRTFTQKVARELSQKSGLMLLCGRYEGFDERIRTGLKPDEISVGDYVLSGGEIAAMIVVDAVVRLLPGALGCGASTADESFENGGLDYPHYTSPTEYRGMKVPEVLLSGHHAEIEKWRREQARKRTRKRRPDLSDEQADDSDTQNGEERRD
ncbi:MAG: tRNA (guanosine(37)-N1)-methyltransferase TrmD [Planctomycetota bacterium]|nr:MAG: tRNA (guanosine(37)-N1)-methyltransferase TrmD [Planctomycetota bacterium]